MRRGLSFISSLFTYWLPILGGLLMLALSFFLSSVSLGLSGAILIVIASLSRLAFKAVEKDAQERAGMNRTASIKNRSEDE